MVILRRKLVQALLDDVVAVKVLDEDDDVQAERENDRMNLDVAAKVSLPDSSRKWYEKID